MTAFHRLRLLYFSGCDLYSDVSGISEELREKLFCVFNRLNTNDNLLSVWMFQKVAGASKDVDMAPVMRSIHAVLQLCEKSQDFQDRLIEFRAILSPGSIEFNDMRYMSALDSLYTDFKDSVESSLFKDESKIQLAERLVEHILTLIVTGDEAHEARSKNSEVLSRMETAAHVDQPYVVALLDECVALMQDVCQTSSAPKKPIQLVALPTPASTQAHQTEPRHKPVSEAKAKKVWGEETQRKKTVKGFPRLALDQRVVDLIAKHAQGEFRASDFLVSVLSGWRRVLKQPFSAFLKASHAIYPSSPHCDIDVLILVEMPAAADQLTELQKIIRQMSSELPDGSGLTVSHTLPANTARRALVNVKLSFHGVVVLDFTIGSLLQQCSDIRAAKSYCSATTSRHSVVRKIKSRAKAGPSWGHITKLARNPYGRGVYGVYQCLIDIQHRDLGVLSQSYYDPSNSEIIATIKRVVNCSLLVMKELLRDDVGSNPDAVSSSVPAFLHMITPFLAVGFSSYSEPITTLLVRRIRECLAERTVTLSIRDFLHALIVREYHSSRPPVLAMNLLFDCVCRHISMVKHEGMQPHVRGYSQGRLFAQPPADLSVRMDSPSAPASICSSPPKCSDDSATATAEGVVAYGLGGGTA